MVQASKLGENINFGRVNEAKLETPWATGGSQTLQGADERAGFGLKTGGEKDDHSANRNGTHHMQTDL